MNTASRAAPQRGSKQSAQGNALGSNAPNKRALKGQKHSYRKLMLLPLQGGYNENRYTQGDAPGEEGL